MLNLLLHILEFMGGYCPPTDLSQNGILSLKAVT